MRGRMTNAVLAVGRNIRRVRERKGVSRDQLAHELDTTTDQVRLWETGQVDIDVDTLDRIVTVLQIKHRDLFD